MAALALPSGLGEGAVLRATSSDKQIRLTARAVIGRGNDCDVVLDDDSVSRRHAELARDEPSSTESPSAGAGAGTGRSEALLRRRRALDQLARLEKVAENIVGSSPGCDQLAVAAHITRADPPSPAHAEVQKAPER